MRENVLKELDAFEADQQWISENWKVLLRQYGEQWVAVKKGRVIASDPEYRGLLSKVADPAHTCIEFVTLEPLEMIL
jgi:hypothetical protein